MSLENHSLDIFIGSGDIDRIKQAIAAGADVNAVSGDFKRTSLIEAVCARSLGAKLRSDVIEILLQHGAKPEIADKDGWTALHAAIFHDDISSAKLLLRDNPKIIDLQMKNGVTPLHNAVFCALSAAYNIDIIRLLLELGADTTIKEKMRGQTALEAARDPFKINVPDNKRIIRGQKIAAIFETFLTDRHEREYRIAVDAQLARIKLKRPNVKFTR